jgi:hypothetical protein
VSNSWFIENPINRDLVKSVTYKIPAETEKEFIIVLKSPLDKPQFSLASFLTLSLANQERKRKVHIEKLLKAGADLEDIEIET